MKKNVLWLSLTLWWLTIMALTTQWRVTMLVWQCLLTGSEWHCDSDSDSQCQSLRDQSWHCQCSLNNILRPRLWMTLSSGCHESLFELDVTVGPVLDQCYWQCRSLAVLRTESDSNQSPSIIEWKGCSEQGFSCLSLRQCWWDPLWPDYCVLCFSPVHWASLTQWQPTLDVANVVVFRTRCLLLAASTLRRLKYMHAI